MTCDVAILGGGPARSTEALLPARAGRGVVVLAQGFGAGESLPPFSGGAIDGPW